MTSVINATADCARKGCQHRRLIGLLAEAEQMRDQAKQLFDHAQTLTRGRQMSEHGALWCDQGNHSFSPRDKGRRVLTVSGFDEDGIEDSDELMACSQHVPQLRTRYVQAAAIPANPDGDDSEGS